MSVTSALPSFNHSPHLADVTIESSKPLGGREFELLANQVLVYARLSYRRAQCETVPGRPEHVVERVNGGIAPGALELGNRGLANPESARQVGLAEPGIVASFTDQDGGVGHDHDYNLKVMTTKVCLNQSTKAVGPPLIRPLASTPVHDEFRIEVEVPRERAHELLDALGSVERRSLGDDAAPEHVAVSHEDGHVFVYADSSEDATRARVALESVLAEQRIVAKPSLRRWHPEEEGWEDASLPLPSTAAEHSAEHAHLEELETEESEQVGHPEWEVRITLPTHHDARAFAERLAVEGIPVRRHWRHLNLGTRDEDEARALAERLRAEAPEGSSFEVEGDAWDAWAEVNAPARPFAIFGGLGQ
jgi:hypothetical protein